MGARLSFRLPGLIDILVNNAGIAVLGPVTETAPAAHHGPSPHPTGIDAIHPPL